MSRERIYASYTSIHVAVVSEFFLKVKISQRVMYNHFHSEAIEVKQPSYTGNVRHYIAMHYFFSDIVNITGNALFHRFTMI